MQKINEPIRIKNSGINILYISGYEHDCRIYVRSVVYIIHRLTACPVKECRRKVIILFFSLTSLTQLQVSSSELCSMDRTHIQSSTTQNQTRDIQSPAISSAVPPNYPLGMEILSVVCTNVCSAFLQTKSVCDHPESYQRKLCVFFFLLHFSPPASINTILVLLHILQILSISIILYHAQQYRTIEIDLDT